MNRIVLSLALAATFFAIDSQAQQISSRTDLSNRLGSNLVFEDFETPSIASQTRYSGGPLNADTTIVGLGNNLVVPGVTFQRNPDYPITNSGYRGID
ncbi:MAG: hypothetical protein ABL925_20200, partial [Methylococcales bacterium]